MIKFSLQSLAKSLGVSKVTVSSALRGKPGVSEELRRRIIAEAKRVGYQPNPAAAELMALVRANRRSKKGDVIAYVNTFKDPERMEKVPYFLEFLFGAKQQAEVYGYKVEEFRAYGKGMSPARLDQVLKARGIRGVLIGPRGPEEPHIELDWPAFSSVVVGESHHPAGLHRVCNHQKETMSLAIKNLVRKGAKSIGVILYNQYESSRSFDYASGIEQARLEFSDDVKIHLVLGKIFTDDQLRGMLEDKNLDSVICLDETLLFRLIAHAAKQGRNLDPAALNLHAPFAIPGVFQDSKEIGRSAVDLLRTLLHAGIRGESLRPRIILIEGSWVERGGDPNAVPVGSSTFGGSLPKPLRGGV